MIANRRNWGGLAVVAAATVAVPAQAGFIFGFTGVTNNDPGDVLIGEHQFQLEVVDFAAGLADFFVRNLGPEASSIANVYFDGTIVLGIDSIFNTDGLVEFEEGGAPGNLPGGGMIGFETDFLASALAPPSMLGVNPDEELGLRISYSGSFGDLIAAITNDELRVGLHGLAFDSGGSEGFVTPAPGALVLFGLAGIGWRRRRR